MANLQERRNRDGKLISYSIRVYKGRDPATGKQLKPYTMTWPVPVDWSEGRAVKEARRQATLFEADCKGGCRADSRQSFAAYAKYVLALKEQAGCKHLTLIRYRQDLERILPVLGHLKLSEITPRHVNQLCLELSKPGMRKNRKALPRPFLFHIIDELSAGVYLNDENGRISLRRARLGESIRAATAQRISDRLGQPIERLFRITREDAPLGRQSITGCQILVSSILSQAERELLIPFNPARRAVTPRVKKHIPSCLQIEEVRKILSALETEPVKWKTAVQLLLVSGCRRGELLGLKWEKVDWENRRICIDCNLLYSSELGIFEDRPKTNESLRYIQLPKSTMELLARHQAFQEQEKARLQSAWQNTPYVFTNEKGGAMNPSRLYNWLQGFSARHDLPHLSPHLFRHTMTSHLFFYGIDSVSISRRLGHAHVSTTTDIYSHVMEQAESRITSCVAEVLLAARLNES